MTDKKRITIYVNNHEYEMIKKLADEKSCSMSKVLCGAVKYYIEKDEFPGFDYDFRWGYWFR